MTIRVAWIALANPRDSWHQEARNLTDVLTHDRHFSQEGFHVMFPAAPAS
jgi:hypothetical protein